MLGHGEEELERSPRVIEALLGRNIVYVACGVAHTIALSGKITQWPPAIILAAIFSDTVHRGGRTLIMFTILLYGNFHTFLYVLTHMKSYRGDQC